MTIATVTTWSCRSCAITHTGNPAAMDRAAEKHTKTTGHSTTCTTLPNKDTSR